MKIIGQKKARNEKYKALAVVECSAIEIGAYGDKIKDDCLLLILHGYHYEQSYYIFYGENRGDNRGHSLTLEEALQVIEAAAQSDVIDLRTLGNHFIEYNPKMQTVAVTNEFDWDDAGLLPLVVTNER